MEVGSQLHVSAALTPGN